jgi:hypothetical protein
MNPAKRFRIQADLDPQPPAVMTQRFLCFYALQSSLDD